jgi:hypothetical protein
VVERRRRDLVAQRAGAGLINSEEMGFLGFVQMEGRKELEVTIVNAVQNAIFLNSIQAFVYKMMLINNL